MPRLTTVSFIRALMREWYYATPASCFFRFKQSISPIVITRMVSMGAVAPHIQSKTITIATVIYSTFAVESGSIISKQAISSLLRTIRRP